MTGEFQETYKHPLRCGWHSLTDPRVRSDFDEFDRWRDIQRRQYCGQFSHDPATALWATLRGEALLPALGIPCDDPACWYLVPLVPIQQGPREYLQKVKLLIHAVAETTGIKAIAE